MKILLLLIISVFLVSCGAEKVEKVAEDVKIVEEDDTISGVDAEEVIQSEDFVNPNL